MSTAHRLRAAILILAAVGVLAGCSTGTDGQATPASTAEATARPPAPKPPGAEVYATATATAEQAAPDNPTDLTVGQAVDVTSDDVTATVKVAKVVKATKPVETTLGQAPANGVFLVASVQYDVSVGELAANPLDWKYVSPSGETYTPFGGNSLFAGFKPQLVAADVRAGRKAAGVIVLDVPRESGGRLTYAPFLSGVSAEWTV